MEPLNPDDLFPFCARAATALLAMQLLRMLARRLRHSIAPRHRAAR